MKKFFLLMCLMVAGLNLAACSGDLECPEGQEPKEDGTECVEAGDDDAT